MQKRHLQLLLPLFLVASFAVIPLLCAEEPDEPTEVILIATQHFISDMPDGYTPAHLRSLLKKSSPDVLAVEAPANIPDPWHLAPMDLWQITKPWADERKITLVPAGWHEPDYGPQIDRMIQGFAASGHLRDFQKLETDFQTASRKDQQTAEHMNSPAASDLWRQYHAGLHALYGKDTAWEDWNKKILANILRICRENKGQRIVVVFGGAHLYYFEDRLKNAEGIRLIPTERLFPIPDEELERNTGPLDHLKALRLLNFSPGMVPESELARLKGVLVKVKSSPKLADDYLLFRGKYLLHTNNPVDALPEFQKLINLDASILSKFDGRTPLRYAGLLNVAVARAQMGEHNNARESLRQILNDPASPPDVRLAAEQFLQTLRQ